MHRHWTWLAAALTTLPLLAPLPSWAAQTAAAEPSNGSGIQHQFVDCKRGKSLARALRKAQDTQRTEIRFIGTCTEVLLINQDNVSLIGAEPDATVVGAVEVRGASNVLLQDFSIRGGPNSPVGASFGGINVLDGSAVTIDGIHVSDISARGIQVNTSAATIRDTTVERAALGNFVFRGSTLSFGGTIVGTGAPFGMSLVASHGSARTAHFIFNNNFFGLLVQLSSGFEHVEGTITTNDNSVAGIFLAGQGIISYGSFVESRGNGQFGVAADELSSFTPLLGAPGGGPGLTVADNPGMGIVATRYSTVELFSPTSVTGNGSGFAVEDSTAVVAGSTITGNGTDVTLSFGANATFNGDDNVFGQPIGCDGTVLVRGTASCAPGARAGASLSQQLEQLRQSLETYNH